MLGQVLGIGLVALVGLRSSRWMIGVCRCSRQGWIDLLLDPWDTARGTRIPLPYNTPHNTAYILQSRPGKRSAKQGTPGPLCPGPGGKVRELGSCLFCALLWQWSPGV